MECLSTRFLADVEQIHPKMNREAPVPFDQLTEEPDVSEPEMTSSSLPQIFSTMNLEHLRSRFPTRGFVAWAQPQD
jgi:hypothetical protein